METKQANIDHFLSETNLLRKLYNESCDHLSYIERRRGESAALGRRMPWANRLFSKIMKGKILNFSHEVEKTISVISVQV